jgi:hypothetical protein
MGGSDDKDLKHNFTLVRCLAFQNRVKGFDQNNNRGSMTLYNCTAFGNGTNYSIDGGSSTLTAINCIAAGSGSSSLKEGTQTTNNLSAATSNFESVDPASAMGPRKADGSLPDIAFMHLKSGSGLIDAGTVIQGVSYGGSKPDLGCFETGVKVATLAPASASFASFAFPQLRGAENVSLFSLSGKKVMDAGPIGLNFRGNERHFATKGLSAGKYLCKIARGNSVIRQCIVNSAGFR